MYVVFVLQIDSGGENRMFPFLAALLVSVADTMPRAIMLAIFYLLIWRWISVSYKAILYATCPV